MACALFLGACVGAPLEEGPEVAVTGGEQGFEQWLAEQPEDRDEAGYYFVDEDLRLDRERAREFYDLNVSNTQLAHLVATNGAQILWNTTDRANLTYCVSNAFTGTQTSKQTIIDLMAWATSQWETAAPVLDFRYVSGQDANCTNTNTNVMFNIVPRTPPGVHTAFFPDWPRADRQLFFLTDLGTVSLELQRRIALHEVGHILGFVHETGVPSSTSNCPENHAPKTVQQDTRYDVASIMHGTSCLGGVNPGATLSQYDKRGVRCAYMNQCEWSPLGIARDVAIGPQAQVWGISNTAANTSSGNGFRLQKWNHTTLVWDVQSTSFGAGVRVAVDSTGLPWWIDNQNRIYRRLSNGTTQLLPGNAVDIAGSANGSMWVLGGLQNNDGWLVYRFDPFLTNWTWVPGATGMRIAVDPAGKVYIVNSAGTVNMYNGSQWQLGIAFNMRAVDVGGDFSVWFIDKTLNSSGNAAIYEYTPQAPTVKFARTTGAALEIAVAQNGQPWVINSLGVTYINVWEPTP